MKVIDSFEQFKETLASSVGIGRTVGMSDETITNLATQVGDFLAKRINPGNREQRLLKELWDVGTEEEQHHLASMLVKMVREETHG